MTEARHLPNRSHQESPKSGNSHSEMGTLLHNKEVLLHKLLLSGEEMGAAVPGKNTYPAHSWGLWDQEMRLS